MTSRKDQYRLDQLINDLKDKDMKELREKFKYVPKEEKPVDWSNYTLAQIRELNDTLILIKNMSEDAYLRVRKRIEHECKVGAPYRKPHEDKAKAILVQQVFGMSDKVTEGLIMLFREKLGITEYINAKCIERAYDDENVMAIVKEVFTMTNEPVRDKETEFSIDGTGESTSIKLNWADDKEEGKKIRLFEKVICMTGVHTKVFSSVVITDDPHDNESPYMEQMVMETNQRYNRMDYVYADAQFLSHHNCDVIESVGAKPRIYPKEGISIKANGSLAWKRMLTVFINFPQRWLEEYHNRSISESANSSWKRRFRKPLNRVIASRRKFECFVRACVHNIRRLAYLRYLWDLDVPWYKP